MNHWWLGTVLPVVFVPFVESVPEAFAILLVQMVCLRMELQQKPRPTDRERTP